MNKDDLMDELSVLQLKELINLIKIGEATAAHHAVIRGLLKDNNIKINRDNVEGDPLEDLLKTLEVNNEDN